MCCCAAASSSTRRRRAPRKLRSTPHCPESGREVGVTERRFRRRHVAREPPAVELQLRGFPTAEFPLADVARLPAAVAAAVSFPPVEFPLVVVGVGFPPVHVEDMVVALEVSAGHFHRLLEATGTYRA